jgi:signal transduction histidine kinase
MQLKIMQDGLAGEVSPKQNEILRRASEKLKTLTSLAAQLLDLAHIETALITLAKERLDLGPLVATQVQFHQARAAQAAIALEMSIPPDLPPVLANREKLQVVFANLISNALKYTPRGGRISVTAGVETDAVRVSVADTGLGIAPEDQEMIFQRFYRVRNEKTREIGGTGLGLAIVKSIVEAHNGRIRVESAPERGSVFHVCFPLAAS